MITDKSTTFKVPFTSLRRFGISISGGRYSHGDTGKFYAIFGSREGIIIEADESAVYGGKLFISPEKSEKFVKNLGKRLEKIE